MIYDIYAKQTRKSFENVERLGILYKFIFCRCYIMLMRLNLICIMKFNTSWSAVYLHNTLYFSVFHRNSGLKTSKNEFNDRIHQNKQSFEGKKLSGKEFLAFKEYQRACVEDMAGSANCTQRFSVLFSSSTFASYPPESFKIICFICIWENLSKHAFIVRKTRNKILAAFLSFLRVRISPNLR